MLYHCGLLSERPERDATLAWVRRGHWDLPGHPPEIEFERRVWLAMPGFSISYHVHTLRVGRSIVKRHIGRDYEELKDVVVENWNSCTREDAIKLAHLRCENGHLPVLSQLAMLDDLKRGMKQSEVARTYNADGSTIWSVKHKGVSASWSFMPPGFELIRS